MSHNNFVPDVLDVGAILSGDVGHFVDGYYHYQPGTTNTVTEQAAYTVLARVLFSGTILTASFPEWFLQSVAYAFTTDHYDPWMNPFPEHDSRAEVVRDWSWESTKVHQWSVVVTERETIPMLFGGVTGFVDDDIAVPFNFYGVTAWLEGLYPFAWGSTVWGEVASA